MVAESLHVDKRVSLSPRAVWKSWTMKKTVVRFSLRTTSWFYCLALLSWPSRPYVVESNVESNVCDRRTMSSIRLSGEERNGCVMWTCWNLFIPEKLFGEKSVSVSLVYAEPVSDDGLTEVSDGQQCGRLPNSELLYSIKSQLAHLPESQRDDVAHLLHSCPSLFNDVPSCTHVL